MEMMDTISTFDIVVCAVMLGCIALSCMRGMITELFDFFGWIVSLILARMFATTVAQIVFPTMQPEAMGVVCAFVVVFVLTRVLQNLIQYALNNVIEAVHLTAVNRLMGGILGALKGILFINIGVLACSFSNLPQSEDWKNAKTSRIFEQLVEFERDWLPELVARQIHFPARLDNENNGLPILDNTDNMNNMNNSDGSENLQNPQNPQSASNPIANPIPKKVEKPIEGLSPRQEIKDKSKK